MSKQQKKCLISNETSHIIFEIDISVKENPGYREGSGKNPNWSPKN
jgi:hypothetical protein